MFGDGDDDKAYMVMDIREHCEDRVTYNQWGFVLKNMKYVCDNDFLLIVTYTRLHTYVIVSDFTVCTLYLCIFMMFDYELL